MNNQLNKYSARITQPKSQGASQAMLYGTGLTYEDMQKAQVGIASMWYEATHAICISTSYPPGSKKVLKPLDW